MVRNVLNAKEKAILPHQEFAGVTTVSKELMFSRLRGDNS